MCMPGRATNEGYLPTVFRLWRKSVFSPYLLGQTFHLYAIHNGKLAFTRDGNSLPMTAKPSARKGVDELM